jgi:hypothetical protein
LGLSFAAGGRYVQVVKRRRALFALLGLLAPAALAPPVLAAEDAAADGEPDKTESPEEIDPDEGIARPDAPDLRSGHIIVRAGGGLWVPSSPFAPAIDELGSLNVGGAFHGQLGVGLNRYLVLHGSGGMGVVSSSDTTCDGCGATTIHAAAGLEFHVNQGFAFDPWVSYGMGYRHTILGLAEQDNLSLKAFEFMRLSIGGDYFPTASFGLGPYMEVDVGVRQLGDPVYYAIFQTGLRLSFDPVAIGTSFTPGQEQTAARR